MSALSDGGAPAESRAPAATEQGIQGAPQGPLSMGAPGGPPPPLPDAVYGHPMSVFLTDRYLNLRVYDSKGEEERRLQAEALEQLRAQRTVEAFFRDGCLVRSAFMGMGGGVLGLLLGSFFFTMKPVDVDTKLSLRAQLREQYKSFIPEVTATAKNFAKIGALYSLTECLIDRERATHDLRGAIYGGCITGALLAMRGGPRAMLGGSLAFGAFSGVIELLQPFAGFE